MKIFNRKAVYRPRQRVEATAETNGFGYYSTPHGIVSYVFGYTEADPFTYFQFIYDGREYTLWYPRIILSGAIAREIKRFVSEIIDESKPK